MKPAIIFFDDGGVLNDNALRAEGWRKLVGEFLSPRLGGTEEAWGEANRVVFDAQWQRFEAWQEQPQDARVDFFTSRAERERWLAEMCEFVGVRVPQGDACLALSIETEQFVIPRLRAAFPEAAGAIRALHDAGHTLATASGHPSDDLARNLEGMGIRDCFTDHLYGPDRAGALKAGAEFYRRIFAHTNVDPAQALIVDDTPRAIAAAAQAGARTVHVRRGDAPAAPAAHHTVTDLLELVELLS